MSRLDPTTLIPGARLPRGVFTRQGVKLLNAGTRVTQALRDSLVNANWGPLYLADFASELSREEGIAEVPQVREGDAAAADLVSRGGVVVVPEGERIEPHHADALGHGAFLGPVTREDRRLRALRIRIADDHVADLSDQWVRVPLQISADPLPPSPASPSGEPWPRTAELLRFRAERTARFRKLFARILAGLRVDVGELLELVDELVELRSAHPERFTQIALLGAEGRDYLPDHCYATAGLSVAIATRLNWSAHHVRLAGLAGLVADVGMGLVPQDLRRSGRPLDEIELNRVRRHPSFSVLLLEAVDALPEEVRMAVYQHHERENCSGYPTGAKSERIGDLSRVVAVADCFAAAAATRSYRISKRPYDALEELIMLGASRVLNRRFVRALVESTGLYPVGSYVRLSDGSAAEVVGAHSDCIDRPIVRILRRDAEGRRADLTVDLADFQPWELHVVTAIDTPANLGPLRAAV